MPQESSTPLVMVIDDEAMVRSVFCMALATGGYHTIQAATAEEAIRLIASGVRPSAFFLDLRMPGMGGLGFLLHLRAQVEGNAAPVAVITGDSCLDHTTRSAVEALDGMVCFKPLPVDEILKVARDLLRRIDRRPAVTTR